MSEEKTKKKEKPFIIRKRIKNGEKTTRKGEIILLIEQAQEDF